MLIWHLNALQQICLNLRTHLNDGLALPAYIIDNHLDRSLNNHRDWLLRHLKRLLDSDLRSSRCDNGLLDDRLLLGLQGEDGWLNHRTRGVRVLGPLSRLQQFGAPV